MTTGLTSRGSSEFFMKQANGKSTYTLYTCLFSIRCAEIPFCFGPISMPCAIRSVRHTCLHTYIRIHMLVQPSIKIYISSTGKAWPPNIARVYKAARVIPGIAKASQKTAETAGWRSFRGKFAPVFFSFRGKLAPGCKQIWVYASKCA